MAHLTRDGWRSAAKPNAMRRAKMRTLTLTDAAWAELTRRAGRGGSRSAVVEAWLAETHPSASGGGSRSGSGAT